MGIFDDIATYGTDALGTCFGDPDLGGQAACAIDGTDAVYQASQGHAAAAAADTADASAAVLGC
jgi:hypothetical protein